MECGIADGHRVEPVYHTLATPFARTGAREPLTFQAVQQELLRGDAVDLLHVDLRVGAVHEVEAWRLNARLAYLDHASRLLHTNTAAGA